jgi:hypothetical protein
MDRITARARKLARIRQRTHITTRAAWQVNIALYHAVCDVAPTYRDNPRCVEIGL